MGGRLDKNQVMGVLGAMLLGSNSMAASTSNQIHDAKWKTLRHSTPSMAAAVLGSDYRPSVVSCCPPQVVREEEILIATLKELTANGWKCDNGYRAGYLTRIKEVIKQRPKCKVHEEQGLASNRRLEIGDIPRRSLPPSVLPEMMDESQSTTEGDGAGAGSNSGAGTGSNSGAWAGSGSEAQVGSGSGAGTGAGSGSGAAPGLGQGHVLLLWQL
ncbi:hypothetical protein SASPL_117982 [Salvia splendens]|uniref:Uncharacterized protein n=1 Tax=Salvia splendens TaxID=180675 RepID=A0A8X8Y0H5_SALSN|nr:hypothetical protein SASPL_117982 [Salvia splendens]